VLNHYVLSVIKYFFYKAEAKEHIFSVKQQQLIKLYASIETLFFINIVAVPQIP